MPFKKFYSLDSHNDHEVSFLLELTSILQNDFNQNIPLTIKSDRTLEHLLNAFVWKTRPVISDKNAESDESLINLAKGEIISNGHVDKIPGHLLNVPLKNPAIITSQAWSVARMIHEDKFSKAGPVKTITIVSTNEVNEWISLIEAAAAIIAFWYRYQDAETKIELLDLSQGIQKGQANKVALNSDMMIFIKISTTTAQFIKLGRTINPDCRMIFHGFESSSVFFANTYLYGLDDFLYEEDLWIMSCEADKQLAQKAWKTIKTEVIPLKTPDLHQETSFKNTKRKDILYFGRISEQKNLHASLFAVSLIADMMRSENRKFRIFGYEDYLGVPNLKIPSQGHLEDLYTIVKKLGLNDLVEFHHAVPVERMEQELAHGIFLSPSVHSDENFGLVAYRALQTGTPVILSNWGGHKDLEQYFSGIEYVDVYETKSGPEVNPYEIAKKLLKIWDKKPTARNSKKSLSRVSFAWEVSKKLESSSARIQVIKRIADAHPWNMGKWPLYGKIFKNHLDPQYLMAMRLYGAKPLPTFSPDEGVLSPLVSMNETEIKIKDSRLGVLRHWRRSADKKIELKQLGNNKISYVSFPEWEWLWENGYIYLKGVL